MEQFPGSVEEAGALLGATITQCGKQVYTLQATPDRMHSSFAVTQPLPSREILTRLHALRALLRTEAERRSSNSTTHFTAAPSLLQVLKKIMGISTQLAVAAAQSELNATKSANSSISQALRRYETPPLMSTALRKLWVDCVVICHRLGDTSKTETVQFVQQMLVIAVLNPRSQKAFGGVRIAALDVIASLLEDDDGQNSNDNIDNKDLKNQSLRRSSLAQKLSSWSLDVLSVCLRALRSAGTGEPTYRVSAVRAACATAVACRKSHIEKQQRLVTESDPNVFPTAWLKGAMEDKAIHEAIKILKQAVTDKFPEVRSAAATLASLLAPLLILSSNNSSTANSASDSDRLTCLEEVLTLASKHIDDESVVVADGWADAFARCIATAVQYNQLKKGETEDGPNISIGETGSPSRYGAAKKYYQGTNASTLAMQFSRLSKAVSYLSDQFVKSGGELSAARAGGSYSVGGRAVRLGYSLTLVKLLQLSRDEIGENRTISTRQILLLILGMINNEAEKTVSGSTSFESQTSTLFGTTGNRTSRSDPGLIQIATCRVIRQGVSEMASEPAQVTILQELINFLPSERMQKSTLNPSQIQIVLIEISHLFATLGEASATRMKDAIPRLTMCLSDLNHGVRHEAVNALLALATIFPGEGSKLILSCLEEIQFHIAELQTIMSANRRDKVEPDSTTNRSIGLFRRASSTPIPAVKNKSDDAARPHQYSIHGKALFVSQMLKELPHLSGGLSTQLLSSAVTVSERLVSCQFNEVLTTASSGVVVSCVRAGFCILSGVLTTGPSGVAVHMPVIVGAWQDACRSAKEGNKNWAAKYDLHMLEAVIGSIVAFLKHCSELILSIPEALNKLTIMLENAFELLSPNGRLGGLAPSVQSMARLESAKSAMFEAFAWLPSGSFPMVADNVFDMTLDQIRQAIEENVICSILPCLVTKEDSILDAKTFSRARADGEAGGARDIEESIVSLSSEVASHVEREAVVLLRSRKAIAGFKGEHSTGRESCILRHFSSDTKVDMSPTPLHTVGTWRQPLDPSFSSKVRLVDSAIQAFSATFGLKDGQQQDKAMAALESLVPPVLVQLARSTGVNAALNEQEKRSKIIDDSAAVTNIMAVLLSCLQALPLHESTHNVPIGLGPPWMSKAKDLFLTFLPVSSTIVRRAAAEGLSLLATLGVTEDAHFLQSTVLHSLDEVMRSFKPESKPKSTGIEFISAARAGSLLTLACIQRTSFKVRQKQLTRARNRASASYTDKAHENLPVLQMMTRILPSVSCFGFRDYFVVKTYALHSFAVLLAYSSRLGMEPMSGEDKQLLLKGVELVEDNFVASWTAASIDVDKGQEADKLTAEIAFLAVLIRLMTFLTPYLRELWQVDPDITRRFCLMAAIIQEIHGSHPSITVEAMAFTEVVAANQELLPSPVSHLNLLDMPLFSIIPAVMASLKPARTSFFATLPWQIGFVSQSQKSLRATVQVVKVLSSSRILISEYGAIKFASHLVALLEATSCSRQFQGSSLFRSLATSRVAELLYSDGTILESEIFEAVPTLFFAERSFLPENHDMYLRWILFARQLMAGSSKIYEFDESSYNRNTVVLSALTKSASDAKPVFNFASPARANVKCLAAQIAAVSLNELLVAVQISPNGIGKDVYFDISDANRVIAKLCTEEGLKKGNIPSSQLVFHLEDVLTATCMSCVAAIDQSEVRTLQEASMHVLIRLIRCFGPQSDPEDSNLSLLDQYSTQVYASIRHALMAPEEEFDVSSSRLFIAGCKALSSCVETKLATDPGILKRLLRPTIPNETDIPFFRFGDPIPESSNIRDFHVRNKRAETLLKCSKIWTSVKILIGNEPNESRPEYMTNVHSELVKDDVGLAVHAISTAFQGIRLLYVSNLSLVGRPLDKTSDGKEKILEGILNLDNASIVDEEVKEMLATGWSSCASCSVRPLLRIESLSQELRIDCLIWVRALLPVFIAGIQDGIRALGLETLGTARPLWAMSIKSGDVLVDCLRGLSLIVSDRQSNLFEGNHIPLFEDLFGLLLHDIIIPTMDGRIWNIESSEIAGTINYESIVAEVSRLLVNCAMSDSELLRTESGLLVCILTPLNIVQDQKVDYQGNPYTAELVAACLTGVSELIRTGSAQGQVVTAMLHLVLSIFLRSDLDLPAVVVDGTRKLLKECVELDSLSSNEKIRVACELSKSKNWELWSVVASVQDGMFVSKSFPIIRNVLIDSSDTKHHVSVVKAILELLQKSPSIPLVCKIFDGLGVDILTILYLYGTNMIPNAGQDRIVLCSAAVKLALAAYQQIVSDDELSGDSALKDFVSVLFQTLLPIVRFNGLPNYPTQNPASDTVLGRICAQAILLTARKTPELFKECVAMMSDIDRPLLEFSVRAEMSGYAVAQEAPAKKKLVLANFKK